MIVVFLDSNVIVSSLIGTSRSPPVVLVDWVASDTSSILVTGRCCVQEVDQVLARKLPTARPIWQQFMVTGGISVVPCPRRHIPGINAKDEAVVAAAMAASARYFVTGDKRLISEMRAARIALPQALNPREMLEELLGQNKNDP